MMTVLLLITQPGILFGQKMNQASKVQYKLLPVRTEAEFDAETNPGDNARGVFRICLLRIRS